MAVLNGKQILFAPIIDVQLQEKNVEPTTETQSIIPDEDFDGLSKVNISPVTSDIDSNITPTNIRTGVTILGVEGNLEADKPNQTKTVTPTTSEQTIVADTGYELASVEIAAVNPSDYYKDEEICNVSPSTSSQNITPSDNKVFNSVNVSAVTSSIDSNITPTNIRTGVTILGVEGNLEVDKPNQTKTATPTTSEQTIVADTGYELASVTVQAVTSSIDSNITPTNIRAGVTVLGVTGNLEPDKPNQTKTVTPTTSQQTIVADTGYELGSVTVNAVNNTIDSNIIAGNIKEGVTILGVTGTVHEGITPTGTTSITSNGTHDVTNYASASVNVPTYITVASESDLPTSASDGTIALVEG